MCVVLSGLLSSVLLRIANCDQFMEICSGSAISSISREVLLVLLAGFSFYIPNIYIFHIPKTNISDSIAGIPGNLSTYDMYNISAHILNDI